MSVPKHTGLSHAAAAVAAVVVAELLAETVSFVIGEAELSALVGALAALLTIEGVVYARESTVEAILLVFFITVLTFLWGYTYHLKRHG